MSTTVQTTGTGSVYIQNLGFTGNSIIATNENGSVNFVPNGTGVIGFGDVGFNNGAISTTLDNLDLVLSPNGTGVVKTDNLQLDGNTISTTNVDGDLLLAPNGTGAVLTGNLQLAGNTLSTTDVDGDLVLAPNGTGNVGLGTSSPGASLEVYRNFNGQSSGSTSAIIGGVDSGISWSGVKILEKGSGLLSSDTKLINMVVDSSSKFVVTGTGNVGIGTTNPEGKLDVNGTIHISGGTATAFATDVDSSNTTNTYISFGQAGTVNDWAYLRQIGGENAYTMALDFHDDSNDGGFSIRSIESTANPDNVATRFCVAPGGNVGIGTSSPGAPLHIGKGSSGSTRAILAVASDSDFKIKVVEQSSSNAAGALQGDFGLYHGTGESFVLRFARGGSGNDGGLSFYTNGANRFNFVSNGDMSAGAYYTTSDDRLKIEETLIKNGLEMCMKLSPQFYTKKDIVESTNETLWKKESGFIAQEIYYDIPELRHIVMLGNDASPLESIKSSSDPSVDPDYSSWGTSAASVNYVEIIPYTVSAIQELSKNQTADNERILELEGEVSFLKEENILLKQQLASIDLRLSAAGL